MAFFHFLINLSSSFYNLKAAILILWEENLADDVTIQKEQKDISARLKVRKNVGLAILFQDFKRFTILIFNAVKFRFDRGGMIVCFEEHENQRQTCWRNNDIGQTASII